jgi:hypothetical protein
LKTNVLCLSARNRRNNYGEVGCVQPKGCSVWVHRTVSGGAPDNVRCASLALVKRLLSEIRRRCMAIIHRTVRWCTGLSGEPTVSWTNGRPRNLRVTRGRANGLKGAPDSVRCANGSKTPTVGCAKTGKKSAPDSVRWCTGLSGALGDKMQELPSWNALNGS